MLFKKWCIQIKFKNLTLHRKQKRWEKNSTPFSQPWWKNFFSTCGLVWHCEFPRNQIKWYNRHLISFPENYRPGKRNSTALVFSFAYGIAFIMCSCESRAISHLATSFTLNDIRDYICLTDNHSLSQKPVMFLWFISLEITLLIISKGSQFSTFLWHKRSWTFVSDKSFNNHFVKPF